MAEEDHAPILLADASVTVGDADTTTQSFTSFVDDTPATASTLAKAELEHSGNDEGFLVSAHAPTDADVRTFLPSARR
jgi:hypothetical protein